MSDFNISNVRAAFVDTSTGALSKHGLDVIRTIIDTLGLPSSNKIASLEMGEMYDPGITDGNLMIALEAIRDLQVAMETINELSSQVQQLNERVRSLEVETAWQ